jgi:phage baseplate assembly protein W
LAITHDLALFQGPLDGSVQEQKLAGFRAKTAILLQRVINCLLTPRGSMMHDPDWGTDFLPNLWDANIDESSIRGRFYIAARQARSAIRQYETDDMDVDERLDDIELESFAINGDQLELVINVRALSGAVSTETALAPLEKYPGSF